MSSVGAGAVAPDPPSEDAVEQHAESGYHRSPSGAWPSGSFAVWDVTPAVAMLRDKAETVAARYGTRARRAVVGIDSVDPAARRLSVLDQRADCGGIGDGRDFRDYATDRGSSCSVRSGSSVCRAGALGRQLTWNAERPRGGSLPCADARHRSVFRAPSHGHCGASRIGGLTLDATVGIRSC